MEAHNGKTRMGNSEVPLVVKFADAKRKDSGAAQARGRPPQRLCTLGLSWLWGLAGILVVVGPGWQRHTGPLLPCATEVGRTAADGKRQRGQTSSCVYQINT